MELGSEILAQILSLPILFFVLGITAALRVAIPEANPSLSLTAAVALTFPLTIIIGIPLYYAVARMWG